MIFVQIDVTSIFMIFTMYLSSFISTFLTLRLAEISLFHKVSSINYEIADKGGGVAPPNFPKIGGMASQDASDLDRSGSDLKAALHFPLPIS